MANTYQGHFPDRDTADDGHAGIAAVRHTRPTVRPVRHGRQRLAVGRDWYRPDYYAQLAASRRDRAQSARARTASTRPNRARRSASCGAARFSAPISTAPVTWSVRAARACRIRARTTWDSGACVMRPHWEPILHERRRPCLGRLSREPRLAAGEISRLEASESGSSPLPRARSAGGQPRCADDRPRPPGMTASLDAPSWSSSAA